MENIYLVEKPGRNFWVTNTDGEIVESSRTIKDLAKKIFENSDLLEAHNFNYLRFSLFDIDDEDEEEIIAEIERLIAQDKNALVMEYAQDN